MTLTELERPVVFLWCRPQPPGSPLPLPPERPELRGRRAVPPATLPAARGRVATEATLWTAPPTSRWCPASQRIVPISQDGRGPFNRLGAEPRSSRESGGGRGAVPRRGARGGWSPRWSRRLWRHESVSVREGREPDRNRNRGREAGPSPGGAGSARPLLTPRPRPGGAAPQSASRTLAAAQPGQERAPPTHLVARLPRVPRAPEGPACCTKEQPLESSP